MRHTTRSISLSLSLVALGAACHHAPPAEQPHAEATPAAATQAPAGEPAPTGDAGLIGLLEQAGFEWEGAAGTSHLVADLRCAPDGDGYACDPDPGGAPGGARIAGDAARQLLANLAARGVTAMSVEIHCRHASEGYEPGEAPPDACEVTAR